MNKRNNLINKQYKAMVYKKETALTVIENLKNDGLDDKDILEVLKEALIIHGVT